MPSTRDPEEAFKRDPSDAEAFGALERKYRDRAERRPLAQLYEAHAAALAHDDQAAELLWRAARAWRDAEDHENERRVLGRTLLIDPRHERTLHRAAELAEQQKRWAELLRCLLTEIDLLRGDVSTARERANLQHRIAGIWLERCYRLDKAMDHYRLALASYPIHEGALADARALLRSIGKWEDVAALCRFELDRVANAKRKVDLLVELGELLEQRLGQLEQAADVYSQAAKLRPGDDGIVERLASLYASPEWERPGGLERANELFLRLAQRRESRNDTQSAIVYLRRALGADPHSAVAAERLARAYEESGRWEDLDRLYQQRSSVVVGAEATQLLQKRADLLQRRLERPAEAMRVLEHIASHEAPDSASWTRLRELYRELGEHRKLVKLLTRLADTLADRAARARLLIEAASVLNDNLAEPDDAAQLWRQVLAMDPTHAEAMEALEQHLARRGDWQGLAALLRTHIEASSAARRPPLEICGQLEKLAQICEHQLGDLKGAREAWEQLARLHPDRQRASGALQNLELRARAVERKLQEIEHELATARVPREHARAARLLGRTLYELGVQHERAIEAFREVMRHEAAEDDTLAMLAQLYRRIADFSGIAWAIKQRLGGLLTRSERIEALRELADINVMLEHPGEAIWAYEELLQLAPHDEQAFSGLRRLLLQVDDFAHLSRALQRRADSAPDAAQRLQSLIELAGLLEQRLDDPEGAINAWSVVLTIYPQHKEALSALVRLYRAGGQAEHLFDTLKKALKVEHGASERASFVRQLAEVAHDLNRRDEALRYFQELVDLQPADKEALGRLARLCELQGRHALLVRALERLGELADNADERLSLAFRRIDVLEERLFEPERAIEIYLHIIREIAPNNFEAHQRLKLLQMGRGRYEEAVRIAEREYFLQADGAPGEPRARELALEIAALWHDQLNDLDRATLAYERVLELDPESRVARQTLHALYVRTRAYLPLVELAPLLLEDLETAPQRQALLLEMAKIWEQQLGDPQQAFDWYARAYEISGDGGAAHAELLRLAEQSTLWDELLGVYERSLASVHDSADRLALLQRMARIAQEKLLAPQRAFSVLEQALAEPAVDRPTLVARLEEIAATGGLHQSLSELYEQLYRAAPSTAEKIAILRRKASLWEERLHDPLRAMRELTRAYRLAPPLPGTAEERALLDDLGRLAAAANDWRHLLFLYYERLRTSSSGPARLELLLELATIYEERLRAPEQALSALLYALMQGGDASRLCERLSRLAQQLGQQPPAPLFDETDLKFVSASTRADGAPPASTTSAHDKLPARSGSFAMPPPPPSLPANNNVRTVAGGLRARGSAGRSSPPRPTGGRKDDSVVELSSVDLLELESGAPSLQAQLPLRAPPPAPDDSPWARIEVVVRACPPADQAVRAEQLAAVAQLWETGAGQPEQAFRVLAEAAGLAPYNTSIFERLDGLAVAHGWVEKLTQLYEDLVERTVERDVLALLHGRAARLLEDQGQLELAERHLSAALEARPDDGASREVLLRVYEQSARWEELATTLERHLLERDLRDEQRTSLSYKLAEVRGERLRQPLRAAEVLVALAARGPEHAGLARRIAECYEAASDWGRATEWLSRAACASEPAERRVLELRRAVLFERELELPDRAIEAYEAILSLDGGDTSEEVVTALARLQQLYRQHDRLDGLVRTLKARAASPSSTPEHRLELQLEAASVLEALGRTDEAADLVEKACRAGSLESSLARRLAAVLRKVGRVGAAAHLLEQQIRALEQAGSRRDELAETLVALAELRLAEPDGGAEAGRPLLERALAVAPEHISVLRTLSRLAEARGDWEDYALLSLRIAHQLQRGEGVRELLQAARRVLGERQEAAAIELIEQAYELAPHDPDVMDALLDACADPERRQAILRERLDAAAAPNERSALLVRLGQLQEQLETAESQSAARVAYREALELVPDHLPALDALSALEVREGRPDSARALLEGVIDRLKPSGGEQLGLLHHRLAQLYEQLDEPDLAYRQLLEARRLRPGDLSVQLTLGQNRYRTRRWREALRYLGKAHEHPEADTCKDEVAQALFNAGICERSLRRPGRALAAFEAALQFDPQHAGALRELAEGARAAAHAERAADFQVRLAMVTDSARERVSMLHQAAELYGGRLRQPERALHCREDLARQLVHGGGEVDRTEREALLRELLEPLARAQSFRLAGDVALALAEMGAEGGDGDQRLRDLLAAGDHYEAAGQWDSADSCRRGALVADPHNEWATAGLVRALKTRDEPDAALTLLEEQLKRPPRAGQERDKGLMRELQALHGWSLQRLGRDQEAIEAYERALRLGEDAAVRLALAELYANSPLHRVAALTNYRELARDITQLGALRSLALAARQGAPYRAYCIYRVLELMGQIDGDGAEFLATFRPPELGIDDPLPGVLAELDRKSTPGLLEPHALGEVLVLLFECLPALIERTLLDHEVDARCRVSPLDESDLAKVFGQVARALDVKKTALYLRPAATHAAQPSLVVAATSPASIVASPEVAAYPVARLRFLLARALELSQPGMILAAGLHPREFSQLLGDVIRAFHPRHQALQSSGADARYRADELRRRLPYSTAKRISEVFRENPDVAFHSALWRQSVLSSANRVGLAVCGDLRVAWREIVRQEPLLEELPVFPDAINQSATARDLLTFAASDGYYACRVKLGLAGTLG